MQTELFDQSEDHSSIWSISGLTREIKKSLQSQFSIVWVRGEISNLRVQSSGHRYFLLKDETSQLKSVLFRGDAAGSAYLPQEGDDCLVYGEITVYEPRGEYQLRVRHLLQDGLGNLRVQFERLKEKLLKEGLFEEERKKALPSLPQSVAIVTSPDGAALQDFLSILRRRNWTGEIWLIPSLVQGKDAPAQLIKGIELASSLPGVDLLVVARGGGSIEDLWSFNDEGLVRCLVACPVPTISAIGHQTDFTLSDFVADLRAETPSAAAEWISSLYLEKMDRLNYLAEKLQHLSIDWIARANDKLSLLGATLERLAPQAKIDRYQQQLDDLEHRLETSVRAILEKNRSNLGSLEQRLEANSLSSSLQRGFTLLTDGKGGVIRSCEDLPPGKEVAAHLADGRRRLKSMDEDLD